MRIVVRGWQLLCNIIDLSIYLGISHHKSILLGFASESFHIRNSFQVFCSESLDHHQLIEPKNLLIPKRRYNNHYLLRVLRRVENDRYLEEQLILSLYLKGYRCDTKRYQNKLLIHEQIDSGYWTIGLTVKRR